MNRKQAVVIVLFGGAVMVTVFAVALYLAFAIVSDRDVAFGESVAVVEVYGEIFYDLGKVQEIEEHRDDDDVKAILIHINSPGGGVAASQALYHAIRSARERKPVVAMMGSVAASGGYYIACAADSIMAHEGTLTGSIGVVATFLRTEDLFHKIGLDVTVIKAGRYKDIGSPYREMTEEERNYMGNLLDTMYFQFLRAISDGRGMSVDQVRELAEGQLFSGEEAVAIGLVDRIGTFEEALYMAAELGGIDGEPRVVRKRRRRPLAERIFGETLSRIVMAGDDRIQAKYIIP